MQSTIGEQNNEVYQTYLRLYLPSMNQQQQEIQQGHMLFSGQSNICTWRELPANPLMYTSRITTTQGNYHPEYMQTMQCTNNSEHYLPCYTNDNVYGSYNPNQDYYQHQTAPFNANNYHHNNSYYNNDNHYEYNYNHNRNYKSGNSVKEANLSEMRNSADVYASKNSWEQHVYPTPHTRTRRNRCKDVDKNINKPYHCDACQKGFSTESEFEAHRATHLYCSSPGCHFTCRSDKPWKMEEHVMLLHNRPNAPDLLDKEKYIAQRRQRFPTHNTIESKVEELYYQAARGVLLPGERRRWLRQHGIIVGKRPRIMRNIPDSGNNSSGKRISYVIRGELPSSSSSSLASNKNLPMNTLTSNEEHGNISNENNTNITTITNTTDKMKEITKPEKLREVNESETMTNEAKRTELATTTTTTMMVVGEDALLKEQNDLTMKKESIVPEQRSALTMSAIGNVSETKRNASAETLNNNNNKNVNNNNNSDNDNDNNNNEELVMETMPSYYVCHRCGRKGEHNVRNCPTRHDSTFDRHIVWGEAKLASSRSRSRKRAKGELSNNRKNETPANDRDKCNKVKVTTPLDIADAASNHSHATHLENNSIDTLSTVTCAHLEDTGIETKIDTETNVSIYEDKKNNVNLNHDSHHFIENADNNNNNNNNDDDNIAPRCVSARQLCIPSSTETNNEATTTASNTNEFDVKIKTIETEISEKPLFVSSPLHESDPRMTEQSSCHSQEHERERTRVLAPVAASRLTTVNQHRSRSNMQKSKVNNNAKRTISLEKSVQGMTRLPTLFERLTEEDRLNERGVLLQAIHYFVINNYFNKQC